MPKVKFTPEEVQEAVDAIPDGWGWHILAMMNSDPTIGHKVHNSHARALVKVRVIGRVPNSGDPQERCHGPYYGVTKLGQLVAEAVGLRLIKSLAPGVIVRDVEHFSLPPGEWFKTVVFGAGMDRKFEASFDHIEPVLYLHVDRIERVPCEVIETADFVREVKADSSVFIHKDRFKRHKPLGPHPPEARISLDVKAFMALDEDARARVCMSALLGLPDQLDQLRGDKGWLTVLEPLSGNLELTLKVANLIQREMDAPAERYGVIPDESKRLFKEGWKHGVASISRGEDCTETVRKSGPQWYYCGYVAALNRWDGSITRYTKLGAEWGCEDPKGPSEGKRDQETAQDVL